MRLASSSPPDSAAHESLAVCLTVLDLNSKTNPAVRKASVVIEALMKAMNVNMEKPHDNGGGGGNGASGAIPRESRMNGISASNTGSAQQSLPDQTGRSSGSGSGNGSTLAQQAYARGTLTAAPPYNGQQQNTNVVQQQANILVPPPADVADGSATTYAVEQQPGSEVYFGDFAFDGMDDILFGFNASESIFQDFM